jgi:hypothetical protein
MVVKGDVLYLIGRDSTKRLENMPKLGSKGTCRAVLTFLEDFCGVRWYLPTPEGEFVPNKRDISVPRHLAKTVIPAFAYGGGHYPYTAGFQPTGGDTPASIINNFREGILVWMGGHTYYHAVPTATYFNDHPEYFALIDGKRTGEGNHLCTSNSHVKQLLVDWVRARFDEGFDWVSIGQEDGYRRCECPECEKLDDYRFESTGLGWDDFMYGGLRQTPAERLFLLHKSVIDEVAKSHPDKKVLLMCYAPTAWPSKKIEYFGDNVILELTNVEPELVKAWQGKATGMTCYIYPFNILTPMGLDIHLSPRETAQKIRYLHTSGFLGIYHQAEAGHGFQGPSYYVFGKLMGDPSLEWRPLVEEYCRGLYGVAADTMLQFFDRLYARHEEVLPLATEDFSGRTNRLPRGINTDDLYLMHYPPAFLNELEQLLEQAESEADTPRSQGWIRLTRDHFDFTKLLTDALISYRAYQANPSKENWREVKNRVEEFDAYRMKIISYPKDYVDSWFPGWETAWCNYLTADAQHESKVYYTPWEKRKPDVLQRGVRGMAIGYGNARGYSFIKEPLTLDFSHPSKAQNRR